MVDTAVRDRRSRRRRGAATDVVPVEQLLADSLLDPGIDTRIDPASDSTVGVVRVGGIDVTAGSCEDIVHELTKHAMDSSRTTLVYTLNMHHLGMLEQPERQAFRDAYARADVVTADGWPIAKAAGLRGRLTSERVPGSDLVHLVSEKAAQLGLRVAILGGTGGSDAAATEALVERFPSLQVVYADPMPIGLTEDPAAVAKLQAALRDSAPDIVFLGVGAPKQEIFADEHLRDCGVSVILCVGAGIDFAAGALRRAPLFVQRMGMEWMFRLVLEPRRLLFRYVRSFVSFAKLMNPRYDVTSPR